MQYCALKIQYCQHSSCSKWYCNLFQEYCSIYCTEIYWNVTEQSIFLYFARYCMSSIEYCTVLLFQISSWLFLHRRSKYLLLNRILFITWHLYIVCNSFSGKLHIFAHFCTLLPFSLHNQYSMQFILFFCTCLPLILRTIALHCWRIRSFMLKAHFYMAFAKLALEYEARGAVCRGCRLGPAGGRRRVTASAWDWLQVGSCQPEWAM